ncbi:hypothetical protein ACFFX0_29785 [Citricoccus parietis]|uniref:Uncharacterized protein n=1 Tax=Citricoccus parietis TaxID=592307 RepID=A0ABV5G862_9MICC
MDSAAPIRVVTTRYARTLLLSCHRGAANAAMPCPLAPRCVRIHRAC